jgi:Zn-dependent peptidase ImmA (M78 family)
MSISAYEKGSWPPAREFLEEIARVLDFPVSWFLQDEMHLVDAHAPTFRAQSRMTARTRGESLRTWDFAALIAAQLRDDYNLPSLSLPDLSEETPESAARNLRDEWRLGNEPISNMVHLLESRGVMVFWTNIQSRSMDACCHWSDDHPIILLNSNERAGERLRFNAAHELGHLVMHREPSKEAPFDILGSGSNGDEVALSENEEDSSDLHSRREREAHRFASAFLMPRTAWQEVSPLQPRLEAFEMLKPHWKVSIQAMVRRSFDLKLISEWQYESAMTRISVNGWRMAEPGELPVEQSSLHRKLFDSMMKNGATVEDFARSLHLRPAVLETLMPTATQWRKKGLRLVRDDVPAPPLLRFVSGG